MAKGDPVGIVPGLEKPLVTYTGPATGTINGQGPATPNVLPFPVPGTAAPGVFHAPTALDPDLANILAAYLASRGGSLAGYDQNQADYTNKYGLDKSMLGSAQDQAGRTLGANMADRGLGQSGIALAAHNRLNQSYGDQFQALGNNFNTELADLAAKRIAANQLYGQQEAGLWSQNTERAAKAFGDKEAAAAAAAQAAAAQAAAAELARQQLQPPPAVEPVAAPDVPDLSPAAPVPQPTPSQTYRPAAPAKIKKPAPVPAAPKPTPNLSPLKAGLGTLKPVTKRYGPQ